MVSFDAVYVNRYFYELLKIPGFQQIQHDSVQTYHHKLLENYIYVCSISI